MGANNGSQDTEPLQREAKKKYKHERMSAYGVLSASLSEPSARKDCSREEKIASRFWDRACFNACRVIAHNYNPIEDFK